MASTIFTLSDVTADFGQFVQQFQGYLQTQPVWVGNLTTQTSQTLIELISSVGTFAQGRIIRAYEDAYAETAESDDAVLSIAQMQGLRLTRFLPSSVQVTLNSPTTVSLPPLTQFQCAGQYLFSNQQLTITAGVPLVVTLYEGKIFSYAIAGLGTERQTWASPQGGFTVSDQDVWVQVNGVYIPKSFGTLWNYDGKPAYADLTLSDGRLLIQFGNLGGINGQFGTIPQVNDQVLISYPVTQGANGNGILTQGKSVTVQGYPLVTGVASANLSGGAAQKSIVAYKNVASGAFGTYSSAVTKSQYQALVATYPGILDVVTQAQREINPGDLRYMNVVQVWALTQSTWTQQQIQNFLTYCQQVTMYAVYFIWRIPQPIQQTVSVTVYIYNSAIPTQVYNNTVQAITNLFAPRPGLLQTNFYLSDLDTLIKAASPGLIDYVEIASPSGDMIVTSPPSPPLQYQIVPGGSGTLGPLVYAYSVSTIATNGDVGFPSNWVFPQILSGQGTNNSIILSWNPIANAAQYQIWGRAAGSGLGLIATISATQTTYTDNGTITPVPPLPSSGTFPVRYNTLGGNVPTVNVKYSERQQVSPGTDPTRLLGGA